jgi:superfamily I DNA and/or RNA helicase
MLKTQFRMHPTICQFISKNFYDGHLKTDDSKAKDYRIAPAHKVISWYDCPGEEFQDRDRSYFNATEVELIADIFFYVDEYGMQSILASRKQILVITFYSAQLKLLQDRLKNVLDDVNEDGIERMKIMTVDGSQGSEADLVSPLPCLSLPFVQLPVPCNSVMNPVDMNFCSACL